MYKAIDAAVPFLEENKFRHLLGIGTPENIVQAVARGCDSFDCVIPTREARHGKTYISKKIFPRLIRIAAASPVKTTQERISTTFSNQARFWQWFRVRLITPLRMSYEDSYAKAFPFDKLVVPQLAILGLEWSLPAESNLLTVRCFH